MVVRGVEGGKGTIFGGGDVAGQGNQTRGTVRLPPACDCAGSYRRVWSSAMGWSAGRGGSSGARSSIEYPVNGSPIHKRPGTTPSWPSLGHQWAEDDENPLEQFVHKLHGMFFAVMWAKKQKHDAAGLLFPVERRKVHQDRYPWYQLQFSGAKAYPKHILPIGPLP